MHLQRALIYFSVKLHSIHHHLTTARLFLSHTHCYVTATVLYVHVSFFRSVAIQPASQLNHSQQQQQKSQNINNNTTTTPSSNSSNYKCLKAVEESNNLENLANSINNNCSASDIALRQETAAVTTAAALTTGKVDLQQQQHLDKEELAPAGILTTAVIIWCWCVHKLNFFKGKDYVTLPEFAEGKIKDLRGTVYFSQLSSWAKTFAD